MKRRLIYLSSLTLTVVVNLTLASTRRGGAEGWKGERSKEMEGEGEEGGGHKRGRGYVEESAC